MDRPHRKVVLADDDPAMLRLMSRWLERNGYDVRQAADGRQALAAVESECPDYLITDWEMPHLDGPELCRRVRQLELPHYVYIFFVTAKAEQHTLVEGLEAGADDFLTKPVQQEELLARLQSASRVLALERRLQQLARSDALTGLITQRTFYELLQHEWHRAIRYRLPLSCVMLDIDFFKRINDLHGHPAGDAVLKAVAQLLRDSARKSDCVSRYGGEEFCVLLPETNSMGAALWAERVRERVSQLAITVGDKQLRLTASFGVAERHDDTQTPEQLVDQADQALLCAKQSGRDRVVRFEALAEAGKNRIEEENFRDDIFAGVTARQIMTPMVAPLRDDTTLGQAAEFFLHFRINSAPVVDSAGKLAGILSEKDLMAAMVSLSTWEKPIREVMKPNVISYEEDTPVRAIYEFLCRVTIRRVVIVRDGVPTGTISRSSLLRWFRNIVLARGLLGDESTEQRSAAAAQRRRERLLGLCCQLLEHTQRLHEAVCRDSEEEVVPCVVGGATQIHSLVTDLLACTRYASEAAAGTGQLQSLFLGSGYTE